jgi:hypothetical protein
MHSMSQARLKNMEGGTARPQLRVADRQNLGRISARPNLSRISARPNMDLVNAPPTRQCVVQQPNLSRSSAQGGAVQALSASLRRHSSRL